MARIKPVTMKVNLSGIKYLARTGTWTSREPAMRTMFKRWTKRYSVFTIRRFRNEGDGDWPAMKTTTRQRRRQAGVGAKLLRDTGTLLAALSIGNRANHQKMKLRSIEYGFAKVSHGASDISVRDLAIVHDSGKGNVPARSILVVPDAGTIKQMNNDAKVAGQALLGKAQGITLRRSLFRKVL